MMRARLLLALTFFSALPLSAGPRPALRVLFVGNSLTYSNGLPAMVERIGRADGRRVVTETVALPDFSLEDHLQSPQAPRAIANQPWDFIVLQQGPSSLDSSRHQFLRDARAFRALPRRNATSRFAVLMVWPPHERAHAWDRVSESHRLAAEAIGAMLVPAGERLRALLDEDPRLPLLAADGFHPAPLGTYLIALTTYRALAGPLPQELATEKGAQAVIGAPARATEEQLRSLWLAANSL